MDYSDIFFAHNDNQCDQIKYDKNSQHWKFLRLGLFFKLILTPAFFYSPVSIHESCPHCGKALLDGGANLDQSTLARRACKSCRRRVGLCFICHEPVKGLYVWCPGCGKCEAKTNRIAGEGLSKLGSATDWHFALFPLFLLKIETGHGGHLSHALQWFGGPSSGGGGVREVCPTGCGHKCNLVKELSAFPRTESMHEKVLFGEFCEVIGGAVNEG